MGEEQRPVENKVPNAGEELAPAEEKVEVVETVSDLDVLKDALSVIDEQKATLDLAEKRIIRDKRKSKVEREGIEIDNIEERVEEILTRKLDELGVKSKLDDDEELKAIQAKKMELEAKAMRLREAAETLKAKNSMSNSGGGSNQDKLRPKTDLSKSLTDDQRVIYQRIADDRGLTLDTVLKAKAVTDKSEESLIQYLKKNK